MSIKLEKELVLSQAADYCYNFLNQKLRKRKYFYWSLDYFYRIDDIQFKSYTLTSIQKSKINDIGKSLFQGSDSDVVFSVKTNSFRNELDIQKLYTKIPNYNQHVLYLKEYVLLLIMKENESLFKNNIDHQEINFIYAYLEYTVERNKPFTFPNFEKFSKKKEYDKLMDSLDLEKDNDEIKNDIKELKDRLKTLNISKDMGSKLNFLFKMPHMEDKEELRLALSILSENKKELLFRGQADSNWMLDSSVTREKALLENEHNLFQNILALKPNEFSNDTTDYEKLITMQHYGLPTRLLDVTRNPLISIFFACNNLNRKNHDGMVYIFKDKEFLNPDDETVDKLTKIAKKSYSDIKNESTGKDLEPLQKNYFIRGVAKNQRINNQSGDFIFVGIDENNKNNENIESLVDEYLIIDYQVKKILIENLEVMNIHGGSVYPELGNMSSYLVNKYKKTY